MTVFLIVAGRYRACVRTDSRWRWKCQVNRRVIRVAALSVLLEVPLARHRPAPGVRFSLTASRPA